MEEQYLTVDEAAAHLRVSRWSISRYIANGELAATKANGRNGAVRILASSLCDYIRRHTVTASEEQR